MILTFKLKKPLPFIFEYLSDMQKFSSVHPVINKIANKGNNTYLVYETLRFGFIPFPFTYPVSVEILPKENTILFEAKVFKITKIEMKFILKEEGIHTIVEEQIQFKSPLPIKSLMKSIFKSQHKQLFKNIETL